VLIEAGHRRAPQALAVASSTRRFGVTIVEHTGTPADAMLRALTICRPIRRVAPRYDRWGRAAGALQLLPQGRFVTRPLAVPPSAMPIGRTRRGLAPLLVIRRTCVRSKHGAGNNECLGDIMDLAILCALRHYVRWDVMDPATLWAWRLSR
jgi:hypothetical protein